MKPPLSQPRRSRPAVVTRARFGHKLARLDDLDLNFCLFFVRCSASARGFGAIGVVQVVGVKGSDRVWMPDGARAEGILHAARVRAAARAEPCHDIAAERGNAAGLRRIGLGSDFAAGVRMQRPLGEPLRGRARIERFDRDLLRIERRIERKLVAGVGDAEEREASSENEVVHRRASCYDRAVLAAMIVTAVIALGACLAVPAIEIHPR